MISIQTDQETHANTIPSLTRPRNHSEKNGTWFTRPGRLVDLSLFVFRVQRLSVSTGWLLVGVTRKLGYFVANVLNLLRVNCVTARKKIWSIFSNVPEGVPSWKDCGCCARASIAVLTCRLCSRTHVCVENSSFWHVNWNSSLVEDRDRRGWGFVLSFCIYSRPPHPGGGHPGKGE